MKNKSILLLFFLMLVMSGYSIAVIADRQVDAAERPISHTLWD